MEDLHQLVRQYCLLPPNANGEDRYYFLMDTLNLMIHLILNTMSQVPHRNENYQRIYATLHALKELLMEYGVDLSEEYR